jgi:hypothetical protein
MVVNVMVDIKADMLFYNVVEGCIQHDIKCLLEHGFKCFAHVKHGKLQGHFVGFKCLNNRII